MQVRIRKRKEVILKRKEVPVKNQLLERVGKVHLLVNFKFYLFSLASKHDESELKSQPDLISKSGEGAGSPNIGGAQGLPHFPGQLGGGPVNYSPYGSQTHLPHIGQVGYGAPHHIDSEAKKHCFLHH